MRGLNATPLIALDAVVIETETTGLDPASARLVEVAAVRLARGRLDEASSLRRLVRPGVPIPAATAIHGIDAAAVAHGAALRRAIRAGRRIAGSRRSPHMPPIFRAAGPPTNAVVVKRLSVREHERRQAALLAARHLDDRRGICCSRTEGQPRVRSNRSSPPMIHLRIVRWSSGEAQKAARKVLPYRREDLRLPRHARHGNGIRLSNEEIYAD